VDHPSVDYNRIKEYLLLSRERATLLGEEAVRIIKAGGYRAPSGRKVDLAPLIAKSVKGTVTYPPSRYPAFTRSSSFETIVRVENETTLSAVIALKNRRLDSAALNMASGKSPGGGFLSGARAQEEYLCRSSTLWACLKDNPMYEFHKSAHDDFYSDYVIFSPDVPVFRTDDSGCIEEPYLASFITSPAIKATGVKKSAPDRVGEIGPAMAKRIRKVLSVAAAHGQTCLVLGAWGCGAFGNDGRLIARLFREAIDGEFHGVFQEIVFAITDWSDDKKFIGPFQKAFAGSK